MFRSERFHEHPFIPLSLHQKELVTCTFLIRKI